MIEKFNAISEQLQEVEKAVKCYAASNSGKRLLVAPLQAARRRVARVLTRIEFLEAARKKGISLPEVVELARIKRLKQADRFSIQLDHK